MFKNLIQKLFKNKKDKFVSKNTIRKEYFCTRCGTVFTDKKIAENHSTECSKEIPDFVQKELQKRNDDCDLAWVLGSLTLLYEEKKISKEEGANLMNSLIVEQY